jgi:hypothetical protein
MNHSYRRRYTVLGIHADANTSIEAAWALANATPILREDFQAQAVVYGWIEPYNRFEVSPHWAYWFARQVIMDHWPPAEDLIRQDQGVWHNYQRYVGALKACGIVGCSTREHQEVVVDVHGQLVEWKGKKQSAEVVSADRVAERVAAFRRNRKKQALLQEDNDED